jgi:hypothetical protein
MASEFKGWLLDALYDLADEIREERRIAERRNKHAEARELGDRYDLVIEEITKRNLKRRRGHAIRRSLSHGV